MYIKQIKTCNTFCIYSKNLGIKKSKSPVKKAENVNARPRQKDNEEDDGEEEGKYEMESELDESAGDSGSQYETETDTSQTTGTEDSIELDRLVKLLLWVYGTMIVIVQTGLKSQILLTKCVIAFICLCLTFSIGDDFR